MNLTIKICYCNDKSHLLYVRITYKDKIYKKNIDFHFEKHLK